MKQEIVCPECRVKIWEQIAATSTFGEHIKIVKGNALDDFLCDGCNRELMKGSRCAAVSVWTDALTKRGRGYYDWESTFIVQDVEELMKSEDLDIEGLGKTEPAD